MEPASQTTIIRDGSLTKRSDEQIHAVVDTNGMPVRLGLTPGEARDNRLCSTLLAALLPQTMLLADRGYDANWIRELLPASKAHGRTFRRNEIVKMRDEAGRVCIAQLDRAVVQQDKAIWSQPDTTSSRLIIWPSSSSHQSEFGCELMSPRA